MSGPIAADMDGWAVRLLDKGVGVGGGHDGRGVVALYVYVQQGRTHPPYC